MTSWSNQSKTQVENPLYTEALGIILTEGGLQILIENGSQIFSDNTKHTSAWGYSDKTLMPYLWSANYQPWQVSYPWQSTHSNTEWSAFTKH